MMYPTELNKAYAAGLYDGEGSIGINRRLGRRRSPEHTLRVVVYQKLRPSLIWLKERWNGSIYGRPVDDAVWCITGSPARRFLLDVFPYLIIKRVQTELALDFMANRVLTPGRAVPEEETAKREAYWVAIKEANHAS